MSRSADYGVVAESIHKAVGAAKVLIDKFVAAKAAADEAMAEEVLANQKVRASQENADEAMLTAARMTLEAAGVVDCAREGVIAADAAIDKSDICDGLAEKAMLDAFAAMEKAQEGASESQLLKARAVIEDAKTKQSTSERMELDALKAIKRGRVVEQAGRSSSLTALRHLNYAFIAQHNADVLRNRVAEKATSTADASREAKFAALNALVALAKDVAFSYSRSVGAPAAKRQRT